MNQNTSNNVQATHWPYETGHEITCPECGCNKKQHARVIWGDTVSRIKLCCDKCLHVWDCVRECVLNGKSFLNHQSAQRSLDEITDPIVNPVPSDL